MKEVTKTKYRKWKQSEVDQIIKLRTKGTPIKEIAYVMGASSTQIRAIIQHHSIPVINRRWTPEDDKVVISMTAEGKKAGEIGAVLGRSSQCINQRRYILRRSVKVE